MTRFIPPGFGWKRDQPDPRDFTPLHPDVEVLLSSLPTNGCTRPKSVDLRQDDEGRYFSTPDNQGCLHSSSSFACLGLIEYFERRTLGNTFEGSALFLYQMARRIAGGEGNTGVGIRTTLKAIRRFGTPPEEMYPYHDEPTSQMPTDISLLGYARELCESVYFRLDAPNTTGLHSLKQLKSFLAAGFPVAFGFSVPRSLTAGSVIPFRPRLDSYRGGQSVVAVGYNDHCLFGNQGAVLVRNSWGTVWGGKKSGYGWLPYSYVISQMAADFWIVVQPCWLQSRELRRPDILP